MASTHLVQSIRQTLVSHKFLFERNDFNRFSLVYSIFRPISFQTLSDLLFHLIFLSFQKNVLNTFSLYKEVFIICIFAIFINFRYYVFCQIQQRCQNCTYICFKQQNVINFVVKNSKKYRQNHHLTEHQLKRLYFSFCISSTAMCVQDKRSIISYISTNLM